MQYVEVNSRDIFETGQLYVGLSRATSVNGLTVTGLNRKVLEMDPDVLDFYKNKKWVDLEQSSTSMAGSDEKPVEDEEQKNSFAEGKGAEDTGWNGKDIGESSNPILGGSMAPVSPQASMTSKVAVVDLNLND